MTQVTRNSVSCHRNLNFRLVEHVAVLPKWCCHSLCRSIRSCHVITIKWTAAVVVLNNHRTWSRRAALQRERDNVGVCDGRSRHLASSVCNNKAQKWTTDKQRRDRLGRTNSHILEGDTTVKRRRLVKYCRHFHGTVPELTQSYRKWRLSWSQTPSIVSQKSPDLSLSTCIAVQFRVENCIKEAWAGRGRAQNVALFFNPYVNIMPWRSWSWNGFEWVKVLEMLDENVYMKKIHLLPA